MPSTIAQEPQSVPVPHLPVLDGWRGISISCVLAGHMLPLGPKALGLNASVAAAGMSLFFFLSGFLIVSILARNDNAMSFLVRRIFRIVPLAWAFLVVLFIIIGADTATWNANLFFYANIPPFYLLEQNSHFWSLSVEIQFYMIIALVVAVAGRAGLFIIPIFCLCITAARIAYGVHISIVTWWRIDEILVGGTLALALNRWHLTSLISRLPSMTPYAAAVLLLLSCDDKFGALNYARPYFAAVLIGSTLFRRDDALKRMLCSRFLTYLAKISFALYVIHPVTKLGWLGEGDVGVRYMKRCLSFLISFVFAHISTFHYERYWNLAGHRVARWIESKSAGMAERKA